MVDHTTRPKYRRLKNLFLNGRLQLRYILIVCGISSIIGTVLGMLIYQQSTFASDQIIASLNGSGMEWIDGQTKDAIGEQLGSSDSGLIITLVLIGIGIALVSVTFLVVLTHRVAGPLHRAAAYFEHLEAGHLIDPGVLRKGDQFHQVFERLGSTHEMLVQRTQEDIEAFAKIIDTASEDPTLTSALQELRALQQEKIASLPSH